MHRLQDLVRFHRMGKPVREIARLLGVGPNTERELRTIFGNAGLLDGPVEELPDLEALRAAVAQARPPREGVPMQEVSSIEAWRQQVAGLWAKGLKPKAIYDRLRMDDKALQGKYWAVKRLCRALKRSSCITLWPHGERRPRTSARYQAATRLIIPALWRQLAGSVQVPVATTTTPRRPSRPDATGGAPNEG